MKVAFLLGSAHVGGGTYVIFQHALAMVKAGWRVCIVTEERVPEGQVDWHPEAKKQLSFVTFDDVAEEQFDVAYATWWRTVYRLHRVNAKKYLYFVQSIESRFFEEWDQAAIRWADATYAYELPTVTEARWIVEYLDKYYGRRAELARNGIRKDVYHQGVEPLAPREAGKLRVLIEGPLNVFFKNVERTVELCASGQADEIWMMTSTKGLTRYPFCDRVFSCVPIHEAARVYASCDVVVKLSYVEGMFGPPLEMFHCGGTCVVYDVTGHDEYIRSGENGLVLQRDDEEGVVKALNTLKNEREYLHLLKENAVRTANSWPSWDQASQEFISATNKLLDQPSPSRQSLFSWNRALSGWYDSHVNAQSELYAQRA